MAKKQRCCFTLKEIFSDQSAYYEIPHSCLNLDQVSKCIYICGNALFATYFHIT